MATPEGVILVEIFTYGGILSIIGALSVDVVIAVIYLCDQTLVNRVSFRLNALISATDLIRTITIMIIFVIRPDNIVPYILQFLFGWTTNLWIFLTACVAYHMQKLFIAGKPLRNWQEKWYYILSIGMSFVFALINILSDLFWENSLSEFSCV